MVLIALLSKVFLEKPPRGGKRERSSVQLSTSVFGMMSSRRKPKRGRKPQQKSKLDLRLRSICSSLDEGIVKAGARMTVGDNKISDSRIGSYAALKLKHQQREIISVSDPTGIGCFTTS